MSRASWVEDWGLRVVVWPVVLSALAFVSIVACGGGSVDETPTPTVAPPTPTPTPEGFLPAGDPSVTVENAVLACRAKDGDLLRNFVAGPVSDEELEALFEGATLERLVRRTEPVVEDGRATVEVRLKLRHERGSEVVDRIWELEQGADGVWRFAALPDCF